MSTRGKTDVSYPTASIETQRSPHVRRLPRRTGRTRPHTVGVNPFACLIGEICTVRRTTPGCSWVILMEAAVAKLFAGESAMNIMTKAVQNHSSYGYVKDYPVERYSETPR